MPTLFVYFFILIECIVLIDLVFYYEVKLAMVMMYRNQQFSAFSLLLKEPS